MKKYYLLALGVLLVGSYMDGSSQQKDIQRRRNAMKILNQKVVSAPKVVKPETSEKIVVFQKKSGEVQQASQPITEQTVLSEAQQKELEEIGVNFLKVTQSIREQFKTKIPLENQKNLEEFMKKKEFADYVKSLEPKEEELPSPIKTAVSDAFSRCKLAVVHGIQTFCSYFKAYAPAAVSQWLTPTQDTQQALSMVQDMAMGGLTNVLLRQFFPKTAAVGDALQGSPWTLTSSLVAPKIQAGISKLGEKNRALSVVATLTNVGITLFGPILMQKAWKETGDKALRTSLAQDYLKILLGKPLDGPEVTPDSISNLGLLKLEKALGLQRQGDLSRELEKVNKALLEQHSAAPSVAQGVAVNILKDAGLTK